MDTKLNTQPLANPRWEAYARFRAEGLTQRRALLAAYPSRAHWKEHALDTSAYKLEKKPAVKDRINALLEKAAERSVITRAEIIDGMAQAFKTASKQVSEGGLTQTNIAAVSGIGGKLLDALPKEVSPAHEKQKEDFALLLAPPFLEVHRRVSEDKGGEFWEYGGRYSTKSSSISLELVYGLERHPDRSCVCFMRVGKYMREGVYEQMLWALDMLGVRDEWDCTVQPLRMVKRSTGQVIAFRGLDDAGKTKAVKAPSGTYYAYQWFEEADQFRGMDEIRKAQQSVTRGPQGAPFFRFYSFNPPRSRMSWVNAVIARRIENKEPVYRSSYLEVPPEWIPKQVLLDADELKGIDEQAYRHEWLGEPVGTGTEVFDRVVFREITDEEIAAEDIYLVGQDFGWYPDPWALTASAWHPSRHELVTFREDGGQKLMPPEQAERIKRALTWPDMLADKTLTEPVYHAERIRSDDADPQAIASQRDAGVPAQAAGKGGMRSASYRWLQSVRWVIDPVRCPHLAAEVKAMEHEVDRRTGEVLEAIPDGNDHWIDATRYAVMGIVRKARGAYRGVKE